MYYLIQCFSVFQQNSDFHGAFHIHFSQGSLLMKNCQETCLGFSVAFHASQNEAKATTEQ